MLYLTQPTDGNLANHVKESILSKMHDGDMGFLAAAKACNVSRARAQAELEADKAFGKKVNSARINLTEVWRETIGRLVVLLETCDNREAAGIRTKIETILKVLAKENPHFKEEQTKSEVNVAVGIVCDEATRAQLIEQRDRLVNGSNGKTDALQPNVDGYRASVEDSLATRITDALP